MDRVIVVSSGPGAGKTTFARALAIRMGATHVELDAVFWGPNWKQSPLDEFRRRVAEVTSGERWVLDGNYSRARDLVWPRADTLVWLDYPLWRTFPRLLLRTFGRWLDRAELWPGTGNRESLRNILLSRDSILWWALKTYRGKRRRFERDLTKPEHAHLRVVRLRRPAEARVWLLRIRTR